VDLTLCRVLSMNWRELPTSETEKLRRIEMDCSAVFWKFVCMPTMAISLILVSSGVSSLSKGSCRLRHFPSSAKPAMTRYLTSLKSWLHETWNMSRVIPLASMSLPVIPLLQRAKKIQETLVWITLSFRVPKLLKRSITFFSTRVLIDFLFKAKCTRANVEYYLTLMSPLRSLQRSITKSITFLSISS
jgi:hypothetical protein